MISPTGGDNRPTFSWAIDSGDIRAKRLGPAGARAGDWSRTGHGAAMEQSCRHSRNLGLPDGGHNPTRGLTAAAEIRGCYVQ